MITDGYRLVGLVRCVSPSVPKIAKVSESEPWTMKKGKGKGRSKEDQRSKNAEAKKALAKKSKHKSFEAQDGASFYCGEHRRREVDAGAEHSQCRPQQRRACVAQVRSSTVKKIKRTNPGTARVTCEKSASERR